MPGPLAWGDAPHFYPEELKELVSWEPLAWTTRGINFGGVNPQIFIFPWLLLYGVLGQLVGNDLAIRVVFYFPAVILAAVGPVLLTKYLGLSKKVQFFSSLVYLLNTYFLLLVDGGQVGVTLAYGFSPVVLLFLKKYFDEPSFFGFWQALIFSFLLTTIDPRVATIVLLTAFLMRPRLKLLVLLSITLAGLNAYWLIPLLKIPNHSFGQALSGVSLVKFRHAMTLFNPHWPGNLFGQTNLPPWYFYGLPVLVIIGAWVGKNWRLLFLFLVFAILTAGILPIETIPFGFVFRDSTKFFVPTILFAGILVGSAVDYFKSKFKIIDLVVYGYLLFLILPALVGQMSFVLSARQHSQDFQKLYQTLQSATGKFRTAWFPEHHPLVYETKSKPALDAKNLVEARPFADMNTGSFDVFNFLHNPNLIDWFRVLGIKYLVFSGDPRIVTPNQDQEDQWNDLLARVATTSGLVKQDWATNFPVYEVLDTRPQVYTVDRLYVVVGSPLGEKPLEAVYFEDGKFDPTNLEEIASDSAKIVFNGKDKSDLAMSFLQDYFIGPEEAKTSQWAVYQPEEYLTYKYQLLIRGWQFNEFDYQKGIAFSTIPGEKMKFKIRVPKDDNYVLAMRKGDPGKGLGWETKGQFYKKGKYEIIVENETDLTVFNVVALIPNDVFQKAQTKADVFAEHFGTAEVDELASEIQEVDYQIVSPVQYRVATPETACWIIFTDSYNPFWKLYQGRLATQPTGSSVPVYSMVNGFYVDPKWSKLEIVFEGQKQVRWGLWATAVSALTLAIVLLWFYPKRDV